jgi:hypothetical protein
VTLLAGSSIDRFAVMNMYYFGMSRFYDTLDWHVQNIPADKLGVGMMNSKDINTNGWVARFHALHTKLGADSTMNLFVMPLSDEWLPWVRTHYPPPQHMLSHAIYTSPSNCAPDPPGRALEGELFGLSQW